MVKIKALIVAAAAVAVTGFSLPLDALESEGFTLTDSQREHSKDFGPIPLFNPLGTASDPTLDDCKTLPSHHAVSVELKVKNTLPNKIEFAVSWPAPPEANDLDIYFFDDEGTHITDSAGSDNPEAFKVAGLPNDVYWVCVANFSGANPGFTVEAKMNFVTPPKFPSPPPDPTPPPVSGPTATAAPASTARTNTDSGPAVTPEAVETPGPDEGSREQALTSLSGSRQATPTQGGRSGVQIALLTLTGVIVAAGAGLVVMRIRRDTSL